MLKTKGLCFLVGVLIILITTQNCFADRRSYVWTYEYMTMPKGMWELEYYISNELPNVNKRNINTWKCEAIYSIELISRIEFRP